MELQLGGGRDKLLDTQNSNYLIVIEALNTNIIRTSLILKQAKSEVFL
jgi:hypothetical protein